MASNDDKLKQLEEENISLKSKLQSYTENEQIYETSLSNIKKAHQEFELNYKKTVSDLKNREDQLQHKFLEYQKQLRNKFIINESQFQKEIQSLNEQLKEREKIISKLNNDIFILNEQLAKKDLHFQFKIRELENVIISKDRKIKELNENFKLRTKETQGEMKLLNHQLYNTNQNNYTPKSSNEVNQLKKIINSLQAQNKNLILNIKNKNNEIFFLRNNNSSQMNNKEKINELKIKKLEKTLEDYGKKLNLLGVQYNQNLIMQNNINKTSEKINENPIFGEMPDIKELQLSSEDMNIGEEISVNDIKELDEINFDDGNKMNMGINQEIGNNNIVNGDFI